MPTDIPAEPYIKKDPNDLIRSGDWNAIQVRARQEIRSHTHKGGEDGTLIPREGIALNAVDGARIDPASVVRVASLTATTALKVNDRDLLADINTLINRANAFDTRFTTVETRLGGLENRATTLESRANALDAAKVNRAGDVITGPLTVNGSLTANSVTRVPMLGIGSAQGTLPAKLSLGTETVNTKIALHDHPTDTYGMGIGGGQFRLHVGNAGARFSFLNAPAGTEVMTVMGNGSVGINTTSPATALHVKSGADAVLRLESTGSRTAMQYIRDNQALWDMGVGTDANNANFWFGDFNSYRLVIERLTGRVGINTTTPTELLTIAGAGSCIELGAGVAKEGNNGKIAYQRWTTGLDIVGAGSTVADRKVTVHAQGGTNFAGNIGVRGYDATSGLPSGWLGGVHTFDIAVEATGRSRGGWQTGGWDLAEKFEKFQEGLEPGDVVVADPEEPERLIRSTGAYQPTLLGVISEKPGFLLGVAWEDPRNPIALGLAGRVPVKVTLEGGPIRIGDPLTSAETPGHAMKATRSGRVIGIALDHFDGGKGPTGKIVVFINNYWQQVR